MMSMDDGHHTVERQFRAACKAATEKINEIPVSSTWSCRPLIIFLTYHKAVAVGDTHKTHQHAGPSNGKNGVLYVRALLWIDLRLQGADLVGC